MNKTIVIYVVLLTIYSYEATNSSESSKKVKCITPHTSDPTTYYCGTDAKNYYSLSTLECEKNTEYGKSINLQLKHSGKCWIWEKYGYETYQVICVSKL